MQNTKKTYQAYYKTNVQTSDQLSLIIMLYDGAIRFMKKGIDRIEKGEVEEAHNYLVRAKDIIGELVSTLKLDAGGEVAKNLKDLYLYAFKKVVEANLRKDPELINEVIQIMDNLRQGWVQMRAQQAPKKQAYGQQMAQKKIRIQG